MPGCAIVPSKSAVASSGHVPSRVAWTRFPLPTPGGKPTGIAPAACAGWRPWLAHFRVQQYALGGAIGPDVDTGLHTSCMPAGSGPHQNPAAAGAVPVVSYRVCRTWFHTLLSSLSEIQVRQAARRWDSTATARQESPDGDMAQSWTALRNCEHAVGAMRASSASAQAT